MLVIAIIAFAIAIGVLVYGFLANRDINAVKEGILIEMDASGQAAEQGRRGGMTSGRSRETRQ